MSVIMTITLPILTSFNFFIILLYYIYFIFCSFILFCFCFLCFLILFYFVLLFCFVLFYFLHFIFIFLIFSFSFLFFFYFILFYSILEKKSIWHPAESRRVCLHFFLRHATVRDDVSDTQRALALGRERGDRLAFRKPE